MYNLTEIIKGFDSEEEQLEAIFRDYTEFRKITIIEEIDSSMIFLIGNFFRKEDHSYDAWSYLHFFLDGKYKERDFSRCDMVQRAFFNKIGKNKSLDFVNNSIFITSKYREEAKSLFSNDITFLSSYFDLYVTGDYLRFLFLKEILLMEF